MTPNVGDGRRCQARLTVRRSEDAAEPKVPWAAKRLGSSCSTRDVAARARRHRRKPADRRAGSPSDLHRRARARMRLRVQRWLSRSISRQPMSRRQKPSGNRSRRPRRRRCACASATLAPARGHVEHAAAAGDQRARRRARCRRGRPSRRRPRPPSMPVDRAALLGRAGIAVRRHHHRQRALLARSVGGGSAPRLLSAQASRYSPRSLSSRIISTWHSGSPKRQLYSISLGPSRSASARRRARPNRACPPRPASRTVGAMIRLDHLAAQQRASARAPGCRRPCRRCWGRCRRRRRACGPARCRTATMVAPSVSAKKLDFLAFHEFLDHHFGAGLPEARRRTCRRARLRPRRGSRR